jgi:phosphatidylglycerol---prolipoprotein diacylglyceryl transferase
MGATGLAVFCYGCFRFIVEFYRVPDAQLGYLALEWVTMGQILSAPMIVIGASLFYLAYFKKA